MCANVLCVGYAPQSTPVPNGADLDVVRSGGYGKWHQVFHDQHAGPLDSQLPTC
jgi:hypothetical protein